MLENGGGPMFNLGRREWRPSGEPLPESAHRAWMAHTRKFRWQSAEER